MIHKLPTNYRQKLLYLWARLNTAATMNVITPLNRGGLCESVVFLHRQRSLIVLMNYPQTADELPTKVISLLTRLHRDATEIEVTALNRAELCESVVFLYSQSSLTVLMNNPQTADELPMNFFPLRVRLDTDATINETAPLNHTELRESVVFSNGQSSLTVLMNDSQNADELPTKVISFLGEAVINKVIPLNRAVKVKVF